jgi:hypothetical protein
MCAPTAVSPGGDTDPIKLRERISASCRALGALPWPLPSLKVRLAAAVWQLLVCAAVCRHHRLRHPASVAHSHPGLPGPGTDLRVAGSARRSSGRSSSWPLRYRAGDPRSVPRLRGRPLRSRGGLLGGLVGHRPVVGHDEGDPIQGAENADRVLEGFTGIEGQSHRIAFLRGRDDRSSSPSGPGGIRHRCGQGSPAAPMGNSHRWPRQVSAQHPIRHLLICLLCR